MPNVMYLANMAHTCRTLADRTEEAETAFNLYELARVYDRQIEVATRSRPRPSSSRRE